MGSLRPVGSPVRAFSAADAASPNWPVDGIELESLRSLMFLSKIRGVFRRTEESVPQASYSGPLGKK